MEESRNTAAIILNRQEYREADSLVTVYTADYGKLSLIARGTQKSGSKLAGHIEPITLADIMIIKGKGFDYIGSALARNTYPGIRNDLNKIYFAGRAISVFNRQVRENEADENMFFLLTSWLETLDSFSSVEGALSQADGELLWSFFALKLLVELGYKPEIYKCISCGRDIQPGNNYFDLISGGIICQECFEKRSGEINESRNYLKISDNCVKLVRFMIDGNISQLSKLRVDRKLVKELSLLVNTILQYNR